VTILPVEKPHVTKGQKMARQVESNLKTMNVTFFDIKGIVHKEFVPTGRTVNSGFYCEVLQRRREKVRRQRPQLWREQTWQLHHGNAPSHTSVLTHQFLVKNKIVVIPHPPYSPDLTPCDFFLLPEMKLKLIGCRFNTIEEIQGESQKVLNTDRKGLPGRIPKMEEMVGPVSACRRELLRGWQRPIGLMVSFVIFTASVRKILDQPSYFDPSTVVSILFFPAFGVILCIYCWYFVSCWNEIGILHWKWMLGLT